MPLPTPLSPPSEPLPPPHAHAVFFTTCVNITPCKDYQPVLCPPRAFPGEEYHTYVVAKTTNMFCVLYIFPGEPSTCFVSFTHISWWKTSHVCSWKEHLPVLCHLHKLPDEKLHTWVVAKNIHLFCVLTQIPWWKTSHVCSCKEHPHVLCHLYNFLM